MSYWDTHNLTANDLAKLGPLVDGVVGTSGQYQDLWAAMIDPAGPMWKRVFVVPGAVMSQDVVIPSGGAYNGASIIGVGGQAVPITGGYQLSIVSDDVYVDRVKLSGATGRPNITISGSRARVNRVFSFYSTTAAGHGIQVTAGTGCYFTECYCYGNGGDGFRLVGGSIANLTTCQSQGNTGWGVNDLTVVGNAIIVHGCLLWGNTAGALNTVSTIVAANKLA